MRRFRRWPAPTALALILAAAATGGARAADTLLTATVKDDGGADRTVRVWVPGGVPVLRGAVVRLTEPGFVERPDYRRFAESQGYALVAADLPAEADAPALLAAAMKSLVPSTGRTELERLPLVPMGFGPEAGPAAIRLAAALPDRTLALVTGGHGEAGVDLADQAVTDALVSVPALTVNPRGDPAAKAWREGPYRAIREKGLPWGLAEWPGEGPEVEGADALAWPMIAEMAEKRVFGATAERKAVPMMSVQVSGGWAGELRTMGSREPRIVPVRTFRGEDAEAAWLPNAYVAALWRAFVADRPSVRTVVRRKGDDVFVRVEGELPERLRLVEYLDGSQLLGVAGPPGFELKVERSLEGVHVLHGVLNAGKRLSTAPAVVIDGTPAPGREAADPPATGGSAAQNPRAGS